MLCTNLLHLDVLTARKMVKVIVVGGTGSGVGKTSLSVGLMAALRYGLRALSLRFTVSLGLV